MMAKTGNKTAMMAMMAMMAKVEHREAEALNFVNIATPTATSR